MKKVFCTVMALVLLLPINSLGFEGRVKDGDVWGLLPLQR